MRDVKRKIPLPLARSFARSIPLCERIEDEIVASNVRVRALCVQRDVDHWPVVGQG